MKLLAIIFALSLHQALSASLPSAAATAPRIINGDTAERGQFPYQALLMTIFDTGRSWCGGSLIHEEWVLTAAHCLIGPIAYEVHLGALDFSNTANEDGRLIIWTDQAILHEGYVGNEPLNDIGLIKLPTPVSFTDLIQPIKLPTLDAGNFDNAVTFASGWGYIDRDIPAPPDQLQYVRQVVVPGEECKAFYSADYFPAILCAWDYNTVNSGLCHGDSGGPLAHIESNTIIGIANFRHYDGCGLAPGGFARVSVYLSWIAENTGISEW